MAYVTKFYTADHHFGHQLMLSETACARPFTDTKAMDEALIRNWNSVVKSDDIVYHLGDFAFGLHDEVRVRSIFSRLMGRKILILGNHDYKKQNTIHPVIAGLAWDQPPCQQYETTDEGERIFLSHYACRTWPGIRKGGWHFFGHNHGQMPPLGRSRDVGVDCKDVGFAPRTFKQLTHGMRSAEIEFEKGA